MTDAVTGWVHPLLVRWAKYITKPVNGYASISVMGRIKEQGLVGASIRSTNHSSVIGNIPKDVLQVHRVIQGLPGELRQVIEARYLHAGSDKEKAKTLDLSRHQYYAWLGKGQTWIAAQVSALDSPERIRQNQASSHPYKSTK